MQPFDLSLEIAKASECNSVVARGNVEWQREAAQVAAEMPKGFVWMRCYDGRLFSDN
jgi:hypothetical protein